MTSQPEPSESDNRYFITDINAELARLVEQERVISKALGGLLPEHADQAAFVAPLQRALDATCGRGGWVLEMARAYPHLQVMGFDINAQMTEYATTQARVGQLENASFQRMNALDPLNYPDNFFDLVNARFLAIIGRPAWPRVVQELFRITRPDGFVRLTEAEYISVTSSAAFQTMSFTHSHDSQRGEFFCFPHRRA